MATFTLTGTGTHSLTPGTVALRVTVTTLPTSAGSGFSYPADQYGVGFLRFTDGTAYWDPWPIVGGPQWIPVPNGSAGVGYALLSVSAVSVTEVSSPAPLAFPLSALPDVALSGLADSQVLTYQASSGKWHNAAGGSGGGGSGGSALIQSILLSATTASVTFSAIPATYSHLQLRWAARGDSSGVENVQQVQFNGDTTSNYTSNYSYSGPGGYSSNAAVNAVALSFPDVAFAGAGAGIFGVGGAEIMFYTGNLQKGCVMEGSAPAASGGTSLYRFSCSGLWHSTATISSITMFPVSGNYVARSLFSLYGLP